jgi:serine/threonine protein kinase
VYEYLKDNFLDLIQNQIPVRARKEILKATLQGIADMHDRDIVHLGEPNDSALPTVMMNDRSFVDVKPDNILVNYRYVDQEVVVDKVQVSDLENAAYLPKPSCIKGMLAGNDNWRSPEGHFKGELNKPSDMYSFGLVVSA